MNGAIVRGVAFCAMVATAQVCAGAAQPVTFDAALTNSMGWTFSGGIKRSAAGRYYIGAKDALVASPDLGFAVTSIVFSVELSSSCTRNFIVAPADDATRPASLAREFRPVPTDTRIAVEWRGSDKVTAFTISSTSGANNLYIDSAEILGTSLLPAPTSLRATYGDGFAVVRWVNPPGAESNVVEVAKIVEKPEDGEVVVRYDFEEFSGGGNPVAITNELPERCAGLSGSLVYAPANSRGVIQLSNGDIDLSRTAALCRKLFKYRKVHAWPPKVAKGELWEQTYADQKRGLNVLPTVDEAIAWANELIAKLDMA